jgi:enolase
MKIRGVDAKAISDSRKEKTILVTIDTDAGKFSASSPTGKSTGKYEKAAYKKSLQEDIKALKSFSDYFSEECIECFEDLRRIEDIIDGHVGANSFFALEAAVLKALAKEQDKEVWQIINQNASKFPRLVGNCVEGGKHSHAAKKPDFQEFLLIPDEESVKENFEKMKKAKEKIKDYLKQADANFKGRKTDEDAWETLLNEKEVLEVLARCEMPIGIDVAASGFYKRNHYCYENPALKRDAEEQLAYLTNLIKNFDVFYVEDVFDEEDFESFAKILKKFPDRLIVGDDLTTTNPKRFEKALKEKAINGIIVKPNQIGSLMEVKEVVDIANKHNIKMIFSHRSGETTENILADLAFGFQADFLKCGITGKEREAKIKRLIEIEKSLR